MYKQSVHDCRLEKSSLTGIPRLSPRASKLRKWLRNFRNQFMVSPENSASKFFFKSTAAIRAERYRQFKQCKPYVIHPFSKFHFKYEMVMSIVWILHLFNNSFTSAYFSDNIDSFIKTSWIFIAIVLEIILWINIAICFLTGVPKDQTKEVVLDLRQIAKHYLSTYFFIDLFIALPINNFYYYANKLKYTTWSTLLSTSHIIEFIRLKTAIQYLTRTWFGFYENSFTVVSLLTLSFFIIHWSACYIYIVPRYVLSFHNNEQQESWLTSANIQPTPSNVSASVARRYFHCLLTAICHIFSAGYGQYEITSKLECTMFSIIMIVGVAFSCYMIATVLELIVSVNISESKYQELLDHVRRYSQRHKLSTKIVNRLQIYYAHQYQHHYFKEQAILNSLSEHLKYEIILYDCKRLIEKVTLFQKFSKTSLGIIISRLKREVFLPGDVISTKDSDSIYFISYGSVAVMLTSGYEYGHFQDGDCFGFTNFFIDVTEDVHVEVAYALEISELFKLERTDLTRCIMHDEEIYEHFYKYAEENYHTMMEHIQKLRNAEIYHNNVLFQLRSGQILEQDLDPRRKVD